MPDDNKRNDEPQLDSKALQQRILRGVKSDTGEKTGKWVMNLKEGVSEKVDIPTQFDEAKASQFPDEMPVGSTKSSMNFSAISMNTINLRQTTN